MARLPEEFIERIKRETDLGALVRSKGITLQAHGSKDLIGHCPFHEDKTPSLVVTPAKNLFHCMGCGAGGTVIDFLMRFDGLSFRHSVDLLAQGHHGVASEADAAVKRTTVPKLPCPLDLEASDAELMAQVMGYYRDRLQQSPDALAYLKQRGIESAIEPFGLGFADRTLGLRLPFRNRADGAAIRERLTKLGLYRESGHEHFNGCIVFPISNDTGEVLEIYGRRIAKQKSKIYHLYLPGPHAGIFNRQCLKEPEIILCESIIDALTFWSAGLKNVTCIYGTEGFTDEHLDAFQSNETKRIYLAYDRDEAGDRAAARDAERLASLGIECFRVKFPHRMDANQYALKLTPAAKSLALLINSAESLQTATMAASAGNLPSLAAKKLATGSLRTATKSLQTAAKEETSPAKRKEPGEASREAQLSQGIALGERSYRAGGVAKNQSFETLKITLRLTVVEGESEGLMHVDSLDLYQDTHRKRFIDRAAEETKIEKDVIKRDLGRLLLQLEAEQEQRLNAAVETESSVPAMSQAERDQAMEVLQDPKLIDRIGELFERCGLVGEETNRLVAYLACTSRKLARPLAVIIQSTSAAGKTTLMDAVLAMFPEEERIKYSAMTGQSLFYLGETNLQHKILAIVEEEGAEKASYALKLLQSEGELTIASTGKDANTGRMKTEEYHVEGPAMIFLTTTSVTMDEELQNRCLVLSVDESREQTQRIHAMQRESRTLAGLSSRHQRRDALALMRNVQRLIDPIEVVNPFSPKLRFYDEKTRTRRDHEKYLALMDAVTLLHQHQREIKTLPGTNGEVRYVETTLGDIEIANRLAPQVLGRCLDELPPQSRRLLDRIKELVRDEAKTKEKEAADIRFTRRQVREAIGWSVTQVRIHLERLQELEYVWPMRGRFGVSYEYRLLVDATVAGEANDRIGLIATDTLQK